MFQSGGGGGVGKPISARLCKALKGAGWPSIGGAKGAPP